jgi:hypothetical protein
MLLYDEPVELPPNDGDEDAAKGDGSPLPFLLVRGLASNVNEDVLSEGLQKLYIEEPGEGSDPSVNSTSTFIPGAPPGAKLGTIPGAIPMPKATLGAPPGSLKRVSVIRDRFTEKNMQYGFAEYHTSSDARAALAKARSLGKKYTISSKQVNVGFPHTGVFPIVTLAEANRGPDYVFMTKNGTTHKYHDDRYYVSWQTINEHPPKPPQTTAAPKDEKSSKKRTNTAAAINSLEASQENTKKLKSEKYAVPAIAVQWQQRQAELRGDDGGEEVQTSSRAPSMETSDVLSFIFKNDKMENICLLCSRNLTNKDGAIISPQVHVNGDLHKKNVVDEAKCEQGRAAMRKRGKTEEDAVRVMVEGANPVAAAVYRNRADERRAQEAAAAGASKISMSLKGVGRKGEKGNAAGLPEPAAAPTPSYGKGMAMLQKAGWKEGSGLGTVGGGISAPIEQSMFAARVGLGHDAGKKGDAVEAAKKETEREGGSFAEKTRELARERFSRM